MNKLLLSPEKGPEIMFATGSILNKSSGPYWSLRDTAVTLAKRGHSVQVLTTRPRGEQQSPDKWSGVRVDCIETVGPPSWHIALDVGRWLERLPSNPDVVSIQNVWIGSNWVIGRWAVKNAIPYMVTLHGNLNPPALGISSLKKKIAARLFFDGLLENAKCLQALNEQEYASIRRYGLMQPVCVIPNGVFAPEQDPRTDMTTVLGTDRPQKRVMLYLGRLHPIKNIPALILAWQSIAARHSDWMLVIAGDGPADYKAQLLDLAKAGSGADIRFVGYVEGATKAAWLEVAELFVLPSTSEGLAVAPLEALSHGTAVLLSRECNFPEVDLVGCGRLSTTTPDSIASVLEELLIRGTAELRAMGARGREFMLDRYSWDAICQQLEEVYAWMANRTGPPGFMRFD